MNRYVKLVCLLAIVFLVSIGEMVMAQAIRVSSMNYKATSVDKKITGFFEDASFVTEGGLYAVKSGKGELKNEKGDDLARGQLETVEDLIAVKAIKGARFEFAPTPESVLIKKWGAEKPKSKAVLTFTADNKWSVDSKDFYFLMKGTGTFSSLLHILVAESILRSSVIKLPKGDIQLFGFKINAPGEGAEVTFEHGEVVAHTKCAVQAATKTK